MSFLGLQNDQGQPTNPMPPPYSKLKYAHNPFPVLGTVNSSVSVPRPEAKSLGTALQHFLTDSAATGGMWVVEADTGIGKSNFLSSIEHEVKSAKASGLLASVRCLYKQSQPVSGPQLVETVVHLLGREQLNLLLQQGPSIRALPPQVRGTELDHFFDSLRTRIQGTGSSSDTDFLLRWLSGAQTTSAERQRYHITSRDKLVPAVALPYLRILFLLLREANLCTKLLLLLDEFEDVLTVSRTTQNEYVTALKGLFNLFNGDGLFIVLSGQPQAVLSVGSKVPSLDSRWEKVSLRPIERSQDAVLLAQAYMQAAHDQYLALQGTSGHGVDISELFPSEDLIKSVFVTLREANPAEFVTQRNLLAELHNRIDRHVQQLSLKA